MASSPYPMAGEQPIQQRQRPRDDEHDHNPTEKSPVTHFCSGGYGCGVGCLGFGLNFRFKYSGSVDAATESNNLFAAPIGRVRVSTKSSPGFAISMLRRIGNGKIRKNSDMKLNIFQDEPLQDRIAFVRNFKNLRRRREGSYLIRVRSAWGPTPPRLVLGGGVCGCFEIRLR